MSKSEKAMAKGNLNRCLLQHNMEAEFTIIKRSVTMAARESPDVWHPKVIAHQSYMVAAMEAV